MMIIRPIQEKDFPALKQIADDSGHGFTSLPNNDELLEKKIERSVSSFSANVTQAGDHGYLFVLEDTDSGEVVGTSGIEAAVGLDDAFYHYHLGKVVHSSRKLNIYNPVDILTLCNDYTGATEICTLFLKDSARHSNNGKLLSKSRFLFINAHKQRFAETVIAEMRGVSNDQGQSPFWKWLEEHFFSMDFPTADYLTGIGQKVFIAELMPKHPIYVNLLSKEAQAVIGHVHEQTRPAIKLLQAEGFTFNGYVDIFDAGPTVEANIDNIRTVRNAQLKTVQIGEPQDVNKGLIANGKAVDFRASLIPLCISGEAITLSQAQADALLVKEGDTVTVSSI